MAQLALLIAILLGICVVILGVIFLLVPIFRAIGFVIASVFKAIGWLIVHIFEFVTGMIGDSLRLIGAIIAGVVLIPLTLLNVIIGRWSAAGHFTTAIKREFSVGAHSLYRIILQRPLKLLLLHGLLEGVEQRIPEAMHGAPTRDKPSQRTGKFENYTIIGSLRGGGSGAKLYVAEPGEAARRKNPNMPATVVIKSFTLADGSSLPQIIRESRALEAARQLGLVLDHALEEHRFFYVMPYLPGDNLGIVTRQLHGEAGNDLSHTQLREAVGYLCDLVGTLSHYHQGGLWHKDVKPENIIINSGRAHLVDLGLVTPLRSAMTLTTHGTEYFRDPELVRQALRGVKVHQVDGAKFDIYAAGAVLYFVLENTFPAHGGLSKFTKKSPPALRWIVNRSMAEYHQRYETAAQMLADLKVVQEAADPFAVKPVDLPSVRDRGDAGQRDDEVAAAFHAATPRPATPAMQGYGVAAGVGDKGPFAQVGRLNLDEHGQPIEDDGEDTAVAERPRLKVTNWWTGAYTLDESDTAGPSPRAVHEARQAADAFRADVDPQFAAARRSAREQVKSARRRAADMRHRAKQRQHHKSARYEHRKPSVLLGMIVLLAIGAILALVFAFSSKSRHSSYIAIDTNGVNHTTETRSATTRDVTAALAAIPPAMFSTADGVLFVDATRLRAADHDLAELISEKLDGTRVISADEASEVVIPVFERLQRGDYTALDQLNRTLKSFTCSVAVIYTDDPRQPLLAYRPEFGLAGPAALVTTSDPDERPSVLIVTDFNGTSTMDRRLNEVVQTRASEFSLRWDHVDDEVLVEAIQDWREDRDGEADALIEDLLEQHDAYGVLYLEQDRRGSIDDLFVYSERAGAKQRTGLATSAAAVSNMRSILINDHPSASNPKVQKQVAKAVHSRLLDGWVMSIDDRDVESALRAVLGTFGQGDVELSVAALDVLSGHDFDAMTLIFATPGDEPAGQRVGVRDLLAPQTE